MKDAKRGIPKFIIPIVAIAFLALLWGINKVFLGGKEDQKAAQQAEVAKKAEAADPKKAEAVAVKVYKTAVSDFEDVLPSIGTIRGVSTVNLRFEQNGMIEKFPFRAGDFIRKGQVIAELAHQDTELKVKFRESKVETAKMGLVGASQKVDVHEKLFAAGAIVQLKLDEIKLEYEKAKQDMQAAKIELESARAELEKTFLPAPIDAILGSKDIEVGEFVTSSVKVGSLIEIKEVLIEMGIIEKDVEKITKGQPVKVHVDAYPDTDFTGEIDSIAPTVEGSRTLTVKAKVPNPDALLLPGMFARVTIEVFHKADALVIPSVALNKSPDGYQVYVVEKDNTITVHPVSVGYATSDKVQIEEGLQADQQVVVDSKGELQEGTKVDIVDIQEGS